MPLKILFADDSVTAQNMGKKILTEAGYEVVAVSNGAAAVKKIAEQKPDIIILDVYMPGYSGLEVCEKVRSSIATIKTPVLLTVGKMEPYKPEEANRVRADGVIIKPFEASDLLAIMKKFEERIEQMAPPPLAPPPIERESVEEVSVQPAEMHHEPPHPANMHSMVEVPDHMATSSAFSDLLGTDATHMEAFPMPAGVAKAAPLPASDEASAPAGAVEYELPVSWRQQAEPQATVVESTLPTAQEHASDSATAEVDASVAAEIAPLEVERPDEVAVRPLQIPVYQEPESNHYQILPTAAAPTGEIDIPREPALQESAAEITRNTIATVREHSLEESAEETTRNTVADAREPGLVGALHDEGTISVPAPRQVSVEVAEPPTTEMNAISAEVSVVEIPLVAAPEPELAVVEPHAVMHPPMPVSDLDFEARVAAAMAAYGHPHGIVDAAPLSSAHDSAAVQAAQAHPTVAAEPSPVEATVITPVAPPEPAPTFEYHPPVSSAEPMRAAEEIAGPVQVAAAIPEPESAAPEAQGHVESEVAHAAAAGLNHDAIGAQVEAELPSAASAVADAAGTGSEHEHHTIAQAVHRVMERMKGDLVQEIVRELKSKK